jgi:hypothetical protein
MTRNAQHFLTVRPAVHGRPAKGLARWRGWRDSEAGRRELETMSTMEILQRRIDATIGRADEVLAERLRREQQALEREAAEDRRADAAQARADAQRRNEVTAIYDDAFRSFGVETPQAADDEAPGRYRRRLFDRLRRKLPPSHSLADVRGDELPPGPAFLNFEQMMLEAAKAEAERPSAENLPADGSMISRTVADADTGEKTTRFFGRRSFIADLGLPSRRVLRLVDPKTLTAIWGAPFSRAG